MTVQQDRHSAVVLYGDRAVTASRLELTVDVEWVPYVQGTVTVPADAGFDPHDGDRVQLHLTQRDHAPVLASQLSAAWAGKTAAQLSAANVGKTAAQLLAPFRRPYAGAPAASSAWFDLVVHKVETPLGRAGSTTLHVASDEVLAQGMGLQSTAPQGFAAASVRAIVEQCLQLLGATLQPGGADGAVEAAAAVWRPGKTMWAFLAPLLQACGLRLYCDGRRTWQLQYVDQLPAGVPLTVTGGRELLEAVKRADLGGSTGWADGVVVEYRWTDAAGAQRVQWDVAGSARPRRTLHVVHEDTPYPGPGAADVILRRRELHSVELPLIARADYRAAPGAVLTVQAAELPTTLQGLVRRVTWSLPDAVMRVDPTNLRDPATIWEGKPFQPRPRPPRPIII